MMAVEKGLFIHTLQSGHVVRGVVRNLAQLGTLFQVWAEQYGLTDDESMACWLADAPEIYARHLGSPEEGARLAASGFAKLPAEIPMLY